MKIIIDFQPGAVVVQVRCIVCGKLEISPMDIPGNMVAVVGLMSTVVKKNLPDGYDLDVPGSYNCADCTTGIKDVQTSAGMVPNVD